MPIYALYVSGSGFYEQLADNIPSIAEIHNEKLAVRNWPNNAVMKSICLPKSCHSPNLGMENFASIISGWFWPRLCQNAEK